MIWAMSIPPGAFVRVQCSVMMAAKRYRFAVRRAALAEPVVDAMMDINRPIAADHAGHGCHLAHVVKVAFGLLSL